MTAIGSLCHCHFMKPEILTSDNESAWILIAGATGVPAGFYRRFANYFVSQGFSVVLFDYSGTGSEAKTSDATYSDWVFRDLPDALQFTKAQANDKPVFYIGHSIGAHVTGATEDWNDIAGAIRVCVTSGYYKMMRKPWKMGFRLRIMLPLSVKIYGYLPARVSGFGADLAKGVALEWSRWCSRPGFGHTEFLDDGDGGHRKLGLSFPVLDVDITDDPYCTPEAKQDIDRFYNFDDREILSVSPENNTKIGHVGFFKKENQKHWAPLAHWMTAQITADHKHHRNE